MAGLHSDPRLKEKGEAGSNLYCLLMETTGTFTKDTYLDLQDSWHTHPQAHVHTSSLARSTHTHKLTCMHTHTYMHRCSRAHVHTCSQTHVSTSAHGFIACTLTSSQACTPTGSYENTLFSTLPHPSPPPGPRRSFLLGQCTLCALPEAMPHVPSSSRHRRWSELRDLVLPQLTSRSGHMGPSPALGTFLPSVLEDSETDRDKLSFSRLLLQYRPQWQPSVAQDPL